MSLDRVFILLVLTFSFDPKEEDGNFPMPGYLLIIPRERVGYEMVNSQRGVESAITKLISTITNGIIVSCQLAITWRNQFPDKVVQYI